MTQKLENPFFNVVLVEPEIPNNTGSIGRTCVGANCRLHLVGKLGFDISDKQLKRSGLDYWTDLDLMRYETFDQWWSAVPDQKRAFFFSKKASRTYFDVQYRQGDWLVFGKETVGLSPEILRQNEDQTVRIPQWGPIRSLNLANAATAALYEALRQVVVAPGTQHR